MSSPQKNVQDQRPFPFREGHAEPVEVTRSQSRDCRGSRRASWGLMEITKGQKPTVSATTYPLEAGGRDRLGKGRAAKIKGS